MRLRLQDFSEIVRTAVRSRDDPARLKQERSESQVELADLDSLRGSSVKIGTIQRRFFIVFGDVLMFFCRYSADFE